MSEEYMTSAEIREKIAELKIRLAFQLEFEEELEQTLAECKEEEMDSTPAMQDSKPEILREIDAATRREARERSGRRRAARAWRVVAIAAILLTVSFGSALAAICMIEAGILKLDIKVQENGTIFRMVEVNKGVEVPEGWRGKYYLNYIPEGYMVSCTKDRWILYENGNGNELYFEEKLYGNRKVVDTENAAVSSVTLNGIEAMVVEKDGWTTVAWSAYGRYFVVEINENRNVALQIAASVDLIE